MNDLGSGIEKVAEGIETLATGIPAPIRKNFFKAIGQLCTAAVDIPVAKMESHAAEIRAASAARVEILKKEGSIISDRLNVPEEYITKASEKFAAKVVKEQINLDQIGSHAAKILSETKIDETNVEETKEISEDWLNEFENYGKLKSSEEMRFMFGKILAGEISKPGTYSIRTLRIISQLDNEAARLFQVLCSHSVVFVLNNEIIDARMIIFKGNVDSNSLKDCGLSYFNLTILEEVGLIFSNFDTTCNYAMCIANENNQVVATMRYNDIDYGLVLIDKSKPLQELKLNGIALNASGRELINIVPKIDVSKYTQELIKFFEKKNLKMVEIKN